MSSNNDTIAALAELFPLAFTAERWRPHRPLKIGIHLDLIDRGVLRPSECVHVFCRYTGRKLYQLALAAGGPRYDLDGNPVGEVTPEQIAYARAAVARMDVKAAKEAAAVRAAFHAARTEKAQPCQASPWISPLSSGPRLGLAELKIAARARKAVSDGRGAP
jgi:ProP effector